MPPKTAAPLFGAGAGGHGQCGAQFAVCRRVSSGVLGVAIATGLSTALSAGLALRRLTKDTLFRLRFRPLIFAPGAIGEILKTGVPSAIQGAVFCFANLFVQASVNTFGATAIAGSTIALNLEYFTYYCNHRLRPNRHHLHQPKPCGLATRALQKNPTALPVVFHPLQPFDDRPHRPVSQCVLPAVYRRSACCSKRLRPHSVYPVFLSPSVTYTKFPPWLCTAPAILCCPRPPWSSAPAHFASSGSAPSLPRTLPFPRCIMRSRSPGCLPSALSRSAFALSAPLPPRKRRARKRAFAPCLSVRSSPLFRQNARRLFRGFPRLAL